MDTVKAKRDKLDAARSAAGRAQAALEARDQAARRVDDEAEAARARVEAAERELRQAEAEDLRQRLERAEQAETETRDSLVDALAVIGKLVAEARGAQGEANVLRGQLGIPVGRDLIEAAVLAAVVDAGLVDARALGVSVGTLRRLNPSSEAERRAREARREEERRLDQERQAQNVDAIVHELRILDHRIRDYGASNQQRKLAEAEAERAVLAARFEAITGAPFDAEHELVAVA